MDENKIKYIPSYLGQIMRKNLPSTKDSTGIDISSALIVTIHPDVDCLTVIFNVHRSLRDSHIRPNVLYLGSEAVKRLSNCNPSLLYELAHGQALLYGMQIVDASSVMPSDQVGFEQKSI